MRAVTGLVSLLLIMAVLWDAFETVVLPRRVTRRWQFTATFRRVAWRVWSARYRAKPPGEAGENYLGLYGPLSQLVLLGLWVVALLVGFAGLQYAAGSPLVTSSRPAGFWDDLYFSGSTFFTLGLGDLAPRSGLAKAATVAEVGTGFAFLALVIGYLPVLYQAFSRREVAISLLDARAGSPPTAFAMIGRCGQGTRCDGINEFLHDWERWSAELLETHLSYPVLGYFRSQHENQSWVAALAAILDVSALISAGLDGVPERQARLTWAMARHAVVDLASVFNTPPRPPAADRLPAGGLARLREALDEAGLPMLDGAEEALSSLRELYEPYLAALADHFLTPLPGWFPREGAIDNWESTAWQPPGLRGRQEAREWGRLGSENGAGRAERETEKRG